MFSIMNTLSVIVGFRGNFKEISQPCIMECTLFGEIIEVYCSVTYVIWNGSALNLDKENGC